MYPRLPLIVNRFTLFHVLLHLLLHVTLNVFYNKLVSIVKRFWRKKSKKNAPGQVMTTCTWLDVFVNMCCKPSMESFGSLKPLAQDSKQLVIGLMIALLSTFLKIHRQQNQTHIERVQIHLHQTHKKNQRHTNIR